MCKVVTSAQYPTNLLDRQPGTMAHSRWLTTASRILRLYVGTVNPSHNLVTLVTYIVRVHTNVV